MTKIIKYSPVDNERRHELIRLVHEDKVSIRQAAIRLNISYPTAKAINRIYKQEERVDKKKFRERKSKMISKAKRGKSGENFANLADRVKALSKIQMKCLVKNKEQS